MLAENDQAGASASHGSPRFRTWVTQFPGRGLSALAQAQRNQFGGG